MTSKLEVIGLGALNQDLIYQVGEILDDGEITIDEALETPGGSAANTVYALAKLGLSAGFVGIVGDDEAGRSLIRDFQSVGVDTSQILITQAAPTGQVLAFCNREGRRSLYVLPGANSLLTKADIPLSYLNRAQLLHLSSFAGKHQLQSMIELVQEVDPRIKISLSPGSLFSSWGLSALEPLIRKATILFLNREEVERLTGQDFKAGARSCLGLGCSMAVITLGADRQGACCYVLSGHGEWMVEAKRSQKREIVDAIGAGDAFAAGFLYGFLKKKRPQACGLLGDITARFSVSARGARAGLPSLDQLAGEYQARTGHRL
ncbi:MAG TPA: carbohydrate kinase family protein [Dehalococcoidia bacterium]|nr:carbohydrate kinase family protein [Dehalococcoidia bacterium]